MASSDSPHQVETTPQQVLEGHILSGPSATACTACGRSLQSTDEVTAYAYRLATADRFNVPRLYCTHGCAPDTLIGTLGATDILATARLGDIAHPSTRRYRICLTEVHIRSFSGPNSGGSP